MPLLGLEHHATLPRGPAHHAGAPLPSRSSLRPRLPSASSERSSHSCGSTSRLARVARSPQLVEVRIRSQPHLRCILPWHLSAPDRSQDLACMSTFRVHFFFVRWPTVVDVRLHRPLYHVAVEWTRGMHCGRGSTAVRFHSHFEGSSLRPSSRESPACYHPRVHGPPSFLLCPQNIEFCEDLFRMYSPTKPACCTGLRPQSAIGCRRCRGGR